MNKIFTDTYTLSRQPILDRTQSLTGFELDLRASHPGSEGNTEAAAALVRFAFGELGAEGVLGRHRGMVNLSPDVLLGDAVDMLAADRVMLNVVARNGLSNAVVERCRALKSRGYSLALEADALQTQEGSQLLPMASVLRVNVAGMESGQLGGVVHRLKPTGRQLLATGVETPETAVLCLQSGFDLLQGQYFARPVIQPGRQLEHGQRALMELLGLVMTDADLPRIVDAFKHYPDIALELVRLANSAAIGARAPSTTVAQAVSMMGRNHLRRWLQLLMFSTGGVSGVEYPSPLMIQAATRGKLMELLAANLWNADRTQQDQGFMVGMLSLLAAQFAIEMEELLAGLPLDQELREALLERAGRMGVLLFLVENLEHPGFENMHIALEGIGMVDPDALMKLQVTAMSWANTLDTKSARKEIA